MTVYFLVVRFLTSFGEFEMTVYYLVFLLNNN